KKDPSWVLGAVANDESGCTVAANPGLDVAAAAAGTGLSARSLKGWADAIRYAIEGIGQEGYDPAKNEYVPVPPNDSSFLGLLAADSVGEWNYYYSDVAEEPGSAGDVAIRLASGPSVVNK